MKDERKRLMPEILPGPGPVASSTPVRQRVLKHMKLLIATGAATTTLVACPYGVVDPLPPPARCRTTGSVLEDLRVEVRPGAPGEVVVELHLDEGGYGDVKLLRVAGLTGAATGEVRLQGYPAEVHLMPDSEDSTIRLTLAVECAAVPVNAVRIELRPLAPDAGAGSSGYTVTVSDAVPDGGP